MNELRNKYDYINYKRMIFISYFIYSIGYMFTFLVENKTLHFEHWIFLIMIFSIEYIILMVPLKRIWLKIQYLLGIILLSFFFKISLTGLDSIQNLILEFMGLFNWIFLIFFLLSFFYLLIRLITEIDYVNKNKLELYPERKEDKKYIVNFLNNKALDINILGIDNDFGTGKTFLMDEVIKELNVEEFEVIKIRCLLLEKEEVYLYVIKLLEKILIKNLIFTGHFDRIKKSLIKSIDSKFLGGFSSSFVKEINLDDIENFKKAIFSLNKTIVLIFDDLDRTSNSEKIEKILSFISDFSENNIKSIVLFNLNNLEIIDERYNRYYIEKYIPSVINLTEISYKKNLLKEIKRLDLKKEDFKFMLSLFEESYKVYENEFKKESKDLNFRKNFSELTELKMSIVVKINSRRIKHFLEEVKIFFDDKELDIEKRIIIGFVFLKFFCYKEFYEKVDMDTSFENLFPIDLKLKEKDIILTLNEYDLLNKLVLESNYNFNDLFNNKNYISLGKERIYLSYRYSTNEKHINSYLKKLKINKLENNSKEEIKEKIYEIEKLLKNSKLEITKETEGNILIYDMFNYFLILKNDMNKSFENNQKIEKAIRKLKFIGTNEYLSSYNRYYKKLKIVLNEKEKNEQLIKYNDLLKEYYMNDGSFEGVFFFGESFEEKSMLILNIFDDTKNIVKFLNLIYFKSKNKITDNYLISFLNCDIKNIEISDFIIDQFIKNNYEIEKKETLTLILKKISYLLIREKFPYEDVFKEITNREFIKEYIAYLEGCLLYKKNDCEEIVKKSIIIREGIKKSIIFLKILLEIENILENKEIKNDFSFSENTELTSQFQKIKDMKKESEKINELEKLYLKGENLQQLEYFFNKVK